MKKYMSVILLVLVSVFSVFGKDCWMQDNGTIAWERPTVVYASTYATNCLIEKNGLVGVFRTAMYGCSIVSNSIGGTDRNGGCEMGGGLGMTNCYVAYNGGYGIHYGKAFNCIFVGNYLDSGGMIGAASLESELLYNCTIVGHTNNAAVISTAAAGTPVANNILWGNASNGVLTSTNLISNYTNDPLFLYTSGTNIFKLQASSPCIDAGNDTYATMPYDFYRRTRIYGTHVDIGAVEWYPEDVPIVETTTGKKRALLNWFLWAY